MIRRAPSWANADDEPDGELPLFGRPAAEGPERFHAGMAASSASASKWTEAQVAVLDSAIERLADRGDEFTADDVWALCPFVPVRKGLSGRLVAASHAGRIRATGEVRAARRGGPHDHAQKLNVWIGVER